MIIDSHSWINKKEHWGDLDSNTMDSVMIKLGWNEVGNDTGITGSDPDVRLKQMDEAGVDKIVLHCMDTPQYGTTIPNEYIAENVRNSNGRFIGLGSFDLLGGPKSIKKIEKAKDELGLVGFKIFPHRFSVRPNDERLFPLYQRVQELDMLMFIHTGWSGYPWMLKYQDSSDIDEVAIRFPEMKIVIVHAGDAKFREVLMMLLKNENLYANTGWWSFLHPLSMNVELLKLAKHYRVLKRLLWGTDNYDLTKDVPFVKSLPEKSVELNLFPDLPELNDKDIKMFMGENIAEVLNL